MVALACLIATLTSTDTISYSTVAKSTGQVLEDLSRITGNRYRALKQVEKLVVIVSVRDRPLPEILSHLAKATMGQWEQKNGETWLVPDTKARAERERRFLADQDQAIRSSLAEYEKLGVLGPAIAPAEQFAKLKLSAREWSPAERLAARILKSMPPGSFSSPKRVSQIVYSTHPRLGERPFPIDISAHVSRYNSERRASGMEIEGDDALAAFTIRVSDPTSMNGIVNFANGKQKFGMLPLHDFAMRRVTKYPAVPLLPFQMSQRTKGLPQLGDMAYQQGDDAIVKTFLEPEKVDPLSGYTSDVWLQIAEATKLNIVMCPPDRHWLRSSLAFPDVMTLRQAAFYFREPNLDFNETWLTCSLQSESPDLGQADRERLTSFMRASVSETGPSIDVVAAFAAASGESAFGHASVIARFAGGSDKGGASMRWNDAKLLAAMPKRRRDSFLNGVPIRLNQLTPMETQALLDTHGTRPFISEANRTFLKATIRLLPTFWVSNPNRILESHDLESLAQGLREGRSVRQDTLLQLSSVREISLTLESEEGSSEVGKVFLRKSATRDEWFTVANMPAHWKRLIENRR